jgi:hypothetical protein
MKTEDHAWQSLRDHAAAQLRGGFADRVIRAAHGAPAEAWQQLNARALAQIRPGFAERVLRAAREIKNVSVPSLFGQFALGAATVAVCFGAVFFAHQRSVRLEEELALARWEQLAAETQDFDQSQ